MRIDLPRVTIHTDGSYFEKIARGGYGGLLNFQNHTCMIFGSEDDTTNNRMELSAVIKALAQLNVQCIVDLHSDSRYVVDAINGNWVSNWQRNGWIKSDRQRVKNIDLWIQLLPYLNYHKVNAFWVKSHNGQFENELCDSIAKSEALSQFNFG